MRIESSNAPNSNCQIRNAQDQVQDALAQVIQQDTDRTGRLKSLEETARACALKV